MRTRWPCRPFGPRRTWRTGWPRTALWTGSAGRSGRSIQPWTPRSSTGSRRAGNSGEPGEPIQARNTWGARWSGLAFDNLSRLGTVLLKLVVEYGLLVRVRGCIKFYPEIGALIGQLLDLGEGGVQFLVATVGLHPKVGHASAEEEG